MSKIENIKQDLASAGIKVEQLNFKHSFGDDVIDVPKELVHSVLAHFRKTQRFDFLMDVCGADYPQREKRFDVVYHLFSSKDASRLRIKAQIGEGETIRSVIDIWKSADWFEREAFDMFGIRFDGHPNLRKILTHEEFVGHPLRKDYDADAQQHATREDGGKGRLKENGI